MKVTDLQLIVELPLLNREGGISMKWNFGFFLSISIGLLCILGLIAFNTEKTSVYVPTLQKYTADTDRIKTICEELLNERNPTEMNRAAMSRQLSKSLRCDDYNGECPAFFDFLTEAVRVSSDNQFESGYELLLRKKYENVIHAFENGKLKLMQ